MEVGLKDFGRNAILEFKQNIIQRLSDAEKDSLYKKFVDRIGDIVTGQVQLVAKKDILVSLDKIDAILPYKEKIPKDRYF